jgi:transposase
MDKEDAGFQTLERLHERRKQVVRLHRKGIGVMRVVALSGLSYPTVRGVIGRYGRNGAESIKPTPRGRQGSDGRHLTAEQERRVRQIICDKQPEQLKMEFALWNRAAVMQLIERECGMKLAVRGVGNYLKCWGITPQKPIKKADEQRPEAVKSWLDNENPAIGQRAKAGGAEIRWGDETAVVNTGVRGRSYAPAGKTPVAFAVGRHAPETVDDRHCHQPGQDTLDDHR